MIVYGTKGKEISGNTVDGMQCPCGSGPVRSSGVLRYFHLYWIPTIPTAKIAITECQSCKRTLTDKEIPSEFLGKIKQSLFTPKVVLPSFAGAIIIAVLIILGVIAAQRSDADQAAYLAHPATNDIYVVDFTKIFKEADSTYKYGALKIKSIEGDQISLQVSRMGYNKTSGVTKDISSNKTSQASYYDEQLMTLDANKIKEMKATGAIVSVSRN